MSKPQGTRAFCPECDVIYPLWDETLLPIARCGRCYGAVVAAKRPRAIDPEEANVPDRAAA
jgi:hypothetical protein